MAKISPSKLLILCFLVLIFSEKLHSQADTVRNQEQFLFPEFNVGVAKMLNGEKVVLNLNYNIVTEKLVFIQNDQIFDIINQSLIDTVFISGRRFIPEGKVFLEIVVAGNSSFYIQHKGSVKRPPRPAAYGGTSEVSSSTYISNIKLGNDRYRLPKNSEIIIEQGPLFWIRRNNEMYLVTGKKSLLKIFADKKSGVKEFIGRSKFDPGNPEQIKGLVTYCNTLP